MSVTTGALTKVESDALDNLLASVDKSCFQSALRRLHTQFNIYANTSPVPLPAPGLLITTEIRAQCELYLPIADIAAVFNHLYSASLTYPPIFSSTPFHNALSWADCFAALLTQFQFSANPARLLESLLADRVLLRRFLFASFLPDRFYGGIGRYPGQQQFIRELLTTRKTATLRCLDAACGTGEDSYALAILLSERGLPPKHVRIDGWTLEPLEVWSATHRRFPHDQPREELLREATSSLLQQGFGGRISFRCVDLTKSRLYPHLPKAETAGVGLFDLILCNGLLGGPIIYENNQLSQTVSLLAQRLAPGGILLAADNFHGGWKQQCPQAKLRALFETHGLQYIDTGEGLGGLKPD